MVTLTPKGLLNTQYPFGGINGLTPSRSTLATPQHPSSLPPSYQSAWRDQEVTACRHDPDPNCRGGSVSTVLWWVLRNCLSLMTIQWSNYNSSVIKMDTSLSTPLLHPTTSSYRYRPSRGGPTRSRVLTLCRLYSTISFRDGEAPKLGSKG